MAYTSQYDQKVNDLYGKIENREPFVYNAADDQLYQQYVDRYQNMGRKAMMDTVGQGAALTGGYTNSYAQNVGQQAYDEYLKGLNDKLMETYQLAYGQYKDQGQDMYNLFNAAGTLAGTDFDRYMQESQFDWNKQMQQAQLDLQREQFEWQKEQAAAAAAGRGGGGWGGGSSKTGDDDKKLAEDYYINGAPGTKGAGTAAGDLNMKYFMRANGITDPAEAYAYAYYLDQTDQRPANSKR